MPYRFIDIKKRLNKLGFMIVRQKGSHAIFLMEELFSPCQNMAVKIFHKE